MDDEIVEGKLFATFERYDEFLTTQNVFLAVDLTAIPDRDEEKREKGLLLKLRDILGEYQEQSYLLDPFLETLVVPAVDCLRKHATRAVSDPAHSTATERVGRLALLLYNYIKSRGYKTIIRFFPHEIEDLSIALGFLRGIPAMDTSQWALRYIVLLWLSLICRLPFDLEGFDEHDRVGETAGTIEAVASCYLGTAGLEREGAAILLSRLYTRKDTQSRYFAFLERSIEALNDSPDMFTSIALLQVFCENVKSGSAGQTKESMNELLKISAAVDQSDTLSGNTLIRKLKTKLMSRIALRLIPPKVRVTRNVRTLSSSDTEANEYREDEDVDVPEEVETILEDLLRCLQDKDTVVRWSAAKGVARLAERLPTDFSNQILETVLGLFSVHSVATATVYDMPTIAEATWHGACLASAEMARRGLISGAYLSEVFTWLSKALYFDIRKGAHSIGSNVRDAAAYVIWAIARAQDPSALQPFSLELAQRLVTVSLYDREIHIRRAASAAFQENVGRTGLFPHGISVLRKTDFYAVSVRRNAFIVAAPQVAEHPEYRSSLIDHLLLVTLRHWDANMRQLGAQSLRTICDVDLAALGSVCLPRISRLFESVDISDIHGGLLALTELGDAYRLLGPEGDEKRQQIFGYLNKIPQEVTLAPRNELVLGAACRLIATTLTLQEIELKDASSVPFWRKIVDSGLRHRSETIQKAAASSMAAVSSLVDCSAIVQRLIPEFRSASSTIQQSLGRLLGVLDYNAHPHGLSEAIQCLLDSVDSNSKVRMMNVEARRNCFLAIPNILSNVGKRLVGSLRSDQVHALFDALDTGLDDYTTDERGDVGSWIRIACIKGLATSIEVLFSNAPSIETFPDYFPASSYHNAVAKILQQGVERLDNVRHVAGECFLRLLELPCPVVDNAENWRIKGQDLMKGLFMSEPERVSWSNGGWLFPKAVRMLEIEEYRRPILKGLILSVGTRTDSTQRPASSSFVEYTNSLSDTQLKTNYSLAKLIQDLIDYAKSHVTSNAVVIPVLQTFNLLLEADALIRLPQSKEGLSCLGALVSLVTRNVSRIKSVQRIQESMKIVTNLLVFPAIAGTCVPQLAEFLGHSFPRVRANTAEYLYLVCQTKDVGCETDEAEDILLETEWATIDAEEAKTVARQLTTWFTKGFASQSS